MTEQSSETLFQKLVRYGVVGVVTTLLHIGLLYVGVEWLGADSTVASSIGFVIAVGFNYQVNYHWTFARPASHAVTIWRYLVMILCGFVINGLVMYAGAQVLGMDYLLVQLVATVVVILWNFILSVTWVYRSRRQS